ncbi:MAG: GNAT family N-acetyltransferase [Acetatifactor sp.]|nr:GNAT family N-acetyltransferase [Acetatifactor sp.]
MNELRDEKAGIYLRPMTYDDTDNIIKWRNSDAVRKNFIYQALFTRESHEKWIKTKVETGEVVQFIICNLADDAPYGSVYIRDIDLNHKKGEYGIFIGEENARGRGIGSATAKLMLKYCFENLKLHRVYLRALSGNMQAIKSYENAGFKREGILHDDVCIDGKFTDIVWMAAVNDAD